MKINLKRILEEEINNVGDITEWELAKRVKIIEKLLEKYPIDETDCRDILRGDYEFSEKHLIVGKKNKNRIFGSIFYDFVK